MNKPVRKDRHPGSARRKRGMVEKYHKPQADNIIPTAERKNYIRKASGLLITATIMKR